MDRDFQRLWAGQAVSQLGSMITRFGLPLTALVTLRATPLQMGFLSGIDGVAVLTFGLLAGAWADRLRRRPLMITSDLLRAALLATIPLAAMLHRLTMGHLYAAAGLGAILTVLFEVSYQSYLPSLVYAERLLECNSKLSMTVSIAEIVGMSVTGILVQILTAPVTILIDAVSFVVSAISVGLIRKPEPAVSRNAATAHMGREIAEGLRAAWHIPVLRALAARAASAAFFLGFFGSLYFLFAVRTLGIGPALVGLIVGVGGGTSLLGAMVAERLVRRFGVGRTLIGAAAVTGVSSLLPPLAHGTVAVCAVYLAVAQLGDIAWSVYNIGETSLRQASVPVHLQGRVNAAMHMTFRGILPIGSLAAGGLAGPFGVRRTLLIGGGGALLSTLWLVFSPLRTLRDLPRHPTSVPFGGEAHSTPS